MVAGLFMLMFVFAVFRPESYGPLLAIGPALLGAALTLFMVGRESPSSRSSALSLSIAGQFATLFGIYEIVFRLS